MTTIKNKDMNTARALLEQRIAAEDALNVIGKSNRYAAVLVMCEHGNESIEVGLNYGIAKQVLKDQLAQIDADLAKLDLKIA